MKQRTLSYFFPFNGLSHNAEVPHTLTALTPTRLSAHLSFLVTLWPTQKHTTLHLLSLYPYLFSLLFFSLASLESQLQIQFQLQPVFLDLS